MNGERLARLSHLLHDILLGSGLGPDRQALAALARARSEPVVMPVIVDDFEVARSAHKAPPERGHQ